MLFSSSLFGFKNEEGAPAAEVGMVFALEMKDPSPSSACSNSISGSTEAESLLSSRSDMKKLLFIITIAVVSMTMHTQ